MKLPFEFKPEDFGPEDFAIAKSSARIANAVFTERWNEFLKSCPVVYSDQKGENWDQHTTVYGDGDTHKGYILAMEDLKKSRTLTLGPEELKLLDRYLYIIECADPRPDLSCHKHIVALDIIAEEVAKARALLTDKLKEGK